MKKEQKLLITLGFGALLASTAGTSLLVNGARENARFQTNMSMSAGADPKPACPSCKEEVEASQCLFSNSATDNMIGAACNFVPGLPSQTRKKCSRQKKGFKAENTSYNNYQTIIDNLPADCDVDLYLVCVEYSSSPTGGIWQSNIAPTGTCGTKYTCEEKGDITYNAPECIARPKE